MALRHTSTRLRALAAGAVVLAATIPLQAIGTSPATAGLDANQLQNGINRLDAKKNALSAKAQDNAAKAHAFQTRLNDLQTQLDGVQTSLDISRKLLFQVQDDLRASRAHLGDLRKRLQFDRAALQDQLVAMYKSQPPDIVNVVLDAKGFNDLLERVDAVKRVRNQNVKVARNVRDASVAVARETTRLSKLETRQQQITTAQQIQRDEIAGLRAQVLAKQSVFTRAQAAANAKLDAVRAQRRALAHQLDQLRPTATAWQGHGGYYGFFQYPGTNYSVGDTPTLATRLDKLGRALGLHLIGISGYRTPQHSVEVGGFANDPHTKGQASDTPGVEGVPESTLNQYGLTRPFGGAREADHIQLLGSI
jgi:peptidoglycan hydrolase CwlO-like protein